MRNFDVLNRLISIPDHHRAWWQVITWWELRRLPYNLVVGLGGILGLLLFLGLTSSRRCWFRNRPYTHWG